MNRHCIILLSCIALIMLNYPTYSNGKSTTNLHKLNHNYMLRKVNIKIPLIVNNIDVAIDDFDNIYINHDASVIVYGKEGNIKKTIDLNVDDKKTLGRLLEVSSTGDMLFIDSKVKPYNRIFVFNNEGVLVNTINYGSLFRLNQKNIYRAENYSKGKIIGIYALNSVLDKIIDYSSYYLPNDKLNQKPKGFLDNNMNLYYMWYWPDFTKIGSTGEFISKQKVAYNAEFWRLIGIDSKNILYALVTRNNKSEIVKFDDKAKIITSIAIENRNNISTAIDNAEEGDAETSNYIVIGNGNIYIKNAYPVNKKKGEYVIYKFEQQLPK